MWKKGRDKNLIIQAQTLEDREKKGYFIQYDQQLHNDEHDIESRKLIVGESNMRDDNANKEAFSMADWRKIRS